MLARLGTGSQNVSLAFVTGQNTNKRISHLLWHEFPEFPRQKVRVVWLTPNSTTLAKVWKHVQWRNAVSLEFVASQNNDKSTSHILWHEFPEFPSGNVTLVRLTLKSTTLARVWKHVTWWNSVSLEFVASQINDSRTSHLLWHEFRLLYFKQQSEQL